MNLIILMELWIRRIVKFFGNSLAWGWVWTTLYRVIYLDAWCIEQRRSLVSLFRIGHWTLSLLLLHVWSIDETGTQGRLYSLFEFAAWGCFGSTCLSLFQRLLFQGQIILSHMERITQRFMIRKRWYTTIWVHISEIRWSCLFCY